MSDRKLSPRGQKRARQQSTSEDKQSRKRRLLQSRSAILRVLGGQLLSDEELEASCPSMYAAQAGWQKTKEFYTIQCCRIFRLVSLLNGADTSRLAAAACTYFNIISTRVDAIRCYGLEAVPMACVWLAAKAEEQQVSLDMVCKAMHTLKTSELHGQIRIKLSKVPLDHPELPSMRSRESQRVKAMLSKCKQKFKDESFRQQTIGMCELHLLDAICYYPSLDRILIRADEWIGQASKKLTPYISRSHGAFRHAKSFASMAYRSLLYLKYPVRDVLVACLHIGFVKSGVDPNKFMLKSPERKTSSQQKSAGSDSKVAEDPSPDGEHKPWFEAMHVPLKTVKAITVVLERTSAVVDMWSRQINAARSSKKDAQGPSG